MGTDADTIMSEGTYDTFLVPYEAFTGANYENLYPALKKMYEDHGKKLLISVDGDSRNRLVASTKNK
jgi:predicted RNA-binding protein (virulence factor B family)